MSSFKQLAVSTKELAAGVPFDHSLADFRYPIVTKDAPGWVGDLFATSAQAGRLDPMMGLWGYGEGIVRPL